MNLYQLSQSYKEIQQLAEESDEQSLIDTLEALDDAIEDKAIGYAKVMRNLEAQAEAIKSEENRLADRRKSIENNVKRMKETLQDNMLYNDKKKIKTDLFTFNIQKNPPTVNIVDEELVPKSYYEEQLPKLNRRELIKAAKENDVPGVELVQKDSLRIR